MKGLLIAMASLIATTQGAWAGARYHWPALQVQIVTADGRPAPNVTLMFRASAPHHQLTHLGFEREWRMTDLRTVEAVTDAEGKATIQGKAGRELWPTWRNETEYALNLSRVRVPGMHARDGRPCETYALVELLQSCRELSEKLTQDDVERLARDGITCKLDATLDQLESRAKEAALSCLSANS